jgi:transglutaminase-like putative cysteine protease
MKIQERLRWTCILAPLVFASAAGAQEGIDPPAKVGTYTYGIEVNDVVCGYVEYDVSRVKEDGRESILIEHEVFMMLSMLGNEFNKELDLIYRIDPVTDQLTYHTSHMVQGESVIDSVVVFEGNEARGTSSLEEGETITALPEGVILPNPLFHPHLLEAFAEEGTSKVNLEVFDITELKVNRVTYTRVGEETLEIAGSSFETIRLESLSEGTGIRVDLWLDRNDGTVVKSALPNGVVVQRAAASVKKKIELVNADSLITTPTNVVISDIQAITYMKVKAVMEPTGIWLTVEDLNGPGQRFEGTVVENRIEGVFEIEHRRFDGGNAPPFPPDFTGEESLREFLEPQDLIESDDPVLVNKARSLAEGSKNSWEAAVRFSRWVADNITYEIPGGVAARKTYDMRAGECGAHSLLLAAFCRAVGIPARVVWGCMYISNYGGSFGQHAWTEIYMGETGWIPVDSTAFETDYVDSGHIRIGIYGSLATSVSTRTMEILDHRLGSGEDPAATAEAADRYAPYLGAYDSPAGGEPFQVLLQGGKLAVSIPGQTVLTFHDPDEKGVWICTMTNNLYLRFPRSEAGEIEAMEFHEIARMRRASEPEEIGEEVPEELRPYLGGYFFAPAQAEFTVLWDDGTLAVRDPIAKAVVHLDPTDEEGWWIDEFGKNSLSFEEDEEGKVITLLFDARTIFTRP